MRKLIISLAAAAAITAAAITAATAAAITAAAITAAAITAAAPAIAQPPNPSHAPAHVTAIVWHPGPCGGCNNHA
jgi:hypothetical protein